MKMRCVTGGWPGGLKAHATLTGSLLSLCPCLAMRALSHSLLPPLMVVMELCEPRILSTPSDKVTANAKSGSKGRCYMGEKQIPLLKDTAKTISKADYAHGNYKKQ